MERDQSKTLTYTSYLRLDELLDLQTPHSQGPDGPEHDELLFIVIHQVYELWFKQILHELEYLQARLHANDTPRASHTMRRILAILKTIVAQVDILETMTPLEFSSFRGFLQSPSGFESLQFREIEFALGYKRVNLIKYFGSDPQHAARLQQRLNQPTLWDAFVRYLQRNGYDVPREQLDRDVTQPLQPDPAIQAILIEVYRTNPLLQNLCERLVDMDEGFQEWRYRHVKMVERTIGMKPGTGGSSGAQYLATTIKPFFPDLWATRSQL